MVEKSLVEYNKDRSKLLVQCGFIKSSKKEDYKYDQKEGVFKPIADKLNASDAEEEELEVINAMFSKTGFPKAHKTYRLSWEMYDLSMEEPYFWILDTLKDGNPIIEKLEDSFAAAENSAFFGVTQQRLGAQQDKVSQYLATSGKMIKELFQMVRELRILDERLRYYNDVAEQIKKKMEQRGKSAEITLKGIFVDLVQGGGKSPASVYGMSRELEFITLPDLFFDAPPFASVDELEKHIKGLEKDFNAALLRVLERHLRQFYEWKFSTHKEHESRKNFMLQYLLQHFEIIKMYVNWVKPYLRHVGKLSFKSKNMVSPDLISAFEGSMLDIELLAQKPVGNGVNGCVLVTFYYRTRPELKVVQEGYQRGPVHIGKMEVYLRAYSWTDEEVENYKKLKEKEALALIGDVSEGVRGAMESLGVELDKYLEEARKKLKQDKKEEKKEEKASKSFMQSFLGEFYRAPQKTPTKTPSKSAKQAREEAEAKKGAMGKAKGHAMGAAWGVYNNFKKSHRMITW